MNPSLRAARFGGHKGGISDDSVSLYVFKYIRLAGSARSLTAPDRRD